MTRRVDEAGICEAYRRGASVKTLSKSMQIREATIRDILARHGVERRNQGSQLVWRGPAGDPRRASILHLVDLKRAGHSPRQTELRVTPDCVSGRAPTLPAFVRSVPGSPGAWCVES